MNLIPRLFASVIILVWLGLAFSLFGNPTFRPDLSHEVVPRIIASLIGAFENLPHVLAYVGAVVRSAFPSIAGELGLTSDGASLSEVAHWKSSPLSAGFAAAAAMIAAQIAISVAAMIMTSRSDRAWPHWGRLELMSPKFRFYQRIATITAGLVIMFAAGPMLSPNWIAAGLLVWVLGRFPNLGGAPAWFLDVILEVELTTGAARASRRAPQRQRWFNQNGR